MKRLIVLAALGLLAASLVGLAASWSRFFDYFNHFRPQMFGGGAALLCLGLLVRSRLTMVLALAALGLNAGMMGYRTAQFWPPSMSETPSNGTVLLKLLSANVLVDNLETADFMKQIETHDPDIVVLLELNPSFQSAMVRFNQRYPHTVIVPRVDSFGVAVYAKYPFKSNVTYHGWYKLPLVQAEFAQFTLLAVHPVSPRTRTDRWEHRTYFHAIREIAAATINPVVLAGDLNATLWSETTLDLLPSGFKHLGGPFRYTWPRHFLPLAIQIDHVFATKGVAGKVTTLGDFGSDHFPILADLQIPTQR